MNVILELLFQDGKTIPHDPAIIAEVADMIGFEPGILEMYIYILSILGTIQYRWQDAGGLILERK